jgi:preprotein translocase subunit SecG
LTTVYSVLLGVDVLLAISIIALVLVQHGKGADAGAAFGSGASATVFGARGSTSFLTRATGVLAALFFINSMGLAYLASHQSEDQSVVERVSVPVPVESPPEEQLQESRPSDLPPDVPEMETLAPESGQGAESGGVKDDVPLPGESSGAGDGAGSTESPLSPSHRQ